MVSPYPTSLSPSDFRHLSPPLLPHPSLSMIRLTIQDFYDWTPTGTEGKFIMSAGGSTTITEFDTWMLRDWWSKAVKARFPSLPAASAAAPEEVASSTPVTSASAPASSAPASETETETETEVATSTPAFSTATAPVEVPTALPTGVFPTGAFPTGAVSRPTGSVRWPRPGRGRGRGRGRRPVPTGRVESFAVFGQ